jgi:hypothetical protein
LLARRSDRFAEAGGERQYQPGRRAPLAHGAADWLIETFTGKHGGARPEKPAPNLLVDIYDAVESRP